MQTIVTLAKLMSAAFTAGKRVSSETGRAVRLLRDGSPSWMTDVVHAAHGDMLPDDWRYKMTETVIDAIAELDDDAGDIEATIDAIEPDIYTSDLTRWLASRADRYSYCDESIEVHGKPDDMISFLQRGQLMEYREIGAAVIDALNAVAEDMNESEAA